MRSRSESDIFSDEVAARRVSTALSGMRLRMELLIDPHVDALSHDAVDIAGPRAEAEAVESVQSSLSLGELRAGCS